MKSYAKRAIIAGLVTASMLGGVVIGAVMFPAASALAATSGGNATNDHAALTQNDAVIDFGRGGEARVTIKLTLNAVPVSSNTADFTVQVIITDTRPNGQIHDTGPNAPTTVR